MELEAGGDTEYEFEAIMNSVVYGQQANNNQIPGFYYLVLWKGYPEKDNTWEPLLAVIHLRKLISTFYKEHPEKPIVTSLSLDSASSMAKPMVPKKPKQKYDCPSKGANKRSRN